VVGDPPPPEEIVGTMNYYSPELVRYIQGAGTAAELTQASDIFALGLIYCEYLTGAMPAFDPAYSGAAIAVLNGATLHIPAGHAPAPMTALVDRMLLADPRGRPPVAEVHATLMGRRSETPTVARPPFPAGTPTVGRPPRRLRPPAAGPAAAGSAVPSRSSGLRGKGLRIGADATRTAAATEPAATTPAADRGRALVGKMIRRLGERRSR
jgi:serine/threonine protein kinase